MPRKRKTEPEGTPAPIPEPALEQVASEVSSVEEYLEITLGQVIVFVMDDQRYALPLEAVQEIQQIVEFTAARGTEPALVGMIDMRGEVVPLIDLRTSLGLTCTPYSLDTPLVFAHVGGRLVALIVDEVEDVIDLSGVPLQAPPRLYSLAERLLGVVRTGDGLLFVLDPHRLLLKSSLASVEASVEEEGEGS